MTVEALAWIPHIQLGYPIHSSHSLCLARCPYIHALTTIYVLTSPYPPHESCWLWMSYHQGHSLDWLVAFLTLVLAIQRMLVSSQVTS